MLSNRKLALNHDPFSRSIPGMGGAPSLGSPESGFVLPEAFDVGANGEGMGSHTGHQHIGFKLHTEEFLLSVTPVQEIIMTPTITFVPKVESGIEGIIALRGEIMPVLNLRRLLRFPKGEVGATTRIIILQSEHGLFGVIVDEITDFVWLQDSDIETIAQNFFSAEYKFLSGVAKTSNRVRGIVDVGKLVANIHQVPDAS